MPPMCRTSFSLAERSAQVDLDLGAGLLLHLDERRIADRRVDRMVPIRLTAGTVPDDVTQVHLRGTLDTGPIDRTRAAGQWITETVELDASPRDGAPVGSTVADLEIGWTHRRRGLLPDRIRWWRNRVVAGRCDARSCGLGGLTPVDLHRLEPDAGVLWAGSGKRRTGVEVVAGSRRGTQGLGHIRAEPDELLVVSRDVVHVFDQAGLHRRTVDLGKGRVAVRFERDADGRLQAWELGGGARYAVVGDDVRIVVHAPAGGWASIDLDPAGRAANIATASGATASLEYDTSGLLTSTTGARGERTTLVHADDGALTSLTYATGERIDLVVDDQPDRRKVSLLTGGGREFSSTDVQGSGADRVHLYRCCGASAPRRRVDQFGATVTTAADGTTTRRSAASVPSRTGTTSTERATVTTPGGRSQVTTIRRRYAGASGSEETVSIGGRDRVRRFDPGTGVTTETSPAGRTDIAQLDPGRRLQIRRAGLGDTIVDFEDERPVRITRGEHVLSVEHDEHGWLAAVVDGPTRREVRHDVAGRVVARQLAGGWMQLTRDVNGDITEVITPTGAVTRFERELDGLVSAIVGPEIAGAAPRRELDYDADRQLIAQRVGDGAEIRYRRDAAGRITAIESDDAIVSMEIDDATGRPVAVRTGDGDATLWTFDGSLLMSEQQQGRVTGRVDLHYGPDHLVQAVAVEGLELIIERDLDGLATVVGPVRLERGVTDPFVRHILAGATVTTRAYDEHGALTWQQTTIGETVLFAEAIRRDAKGRVVELAETDAGGTRVWTYGYDEHRLASADLDGLPMLRLSRDAVGNVVECQRGEATSTTGIDAADRVTSIDGIPIEFGPAGEQLTGPKQARHQFDALGRLAGVVTAEGTQIGHVHDGLGRLIESTAAGAAYRRLLWTRDRIAAVWDGQGVLRRCVWAAESVAPLALLDGDRVLRLVTDHRGSVRLVVDASSGQILQRLDYDPLGRVTVDTAPGLQPFGFAGSVHDPYTGHVHLGRRVLDPTTGRFLTPDPIGFEGGQVNLYLYADGDPVNRADPHGTQSSGGGGVEVCTAPFIGARPFSVDHVSVKGDGWQHGQGPPADAKGFDRLMTEWVDETTHPEGKAGHPEEHCRPVENVDEECLRRNTQPGNPTGFYGLGVGESNMCYDNVYDALDACAGPGGWDFGDAPPGEGQGPIEKVWDAARSATNAASEPARSALNTVKEWLGQ